MTPEQRIAEIVRLENFRTGLQKQVNHYTELIKECLIDNAIVLSDYKIGDVVIASVKVDSQGEVHKDYYGHPKSFSHICKVHRVCSKVYDAKSKSGAVIPGKYETSLYYTLIPVLCPKIECDEVHLSDIKGRYEA